MTAKTKVKTVTIGVEESTYRDLERLREAERRKMELPKLSWNAFLRRVVSRIKGEKDAR